VLYRLLVKGLATVKTPPSFARDDYRRHYRHHLARSLEHELVQELAFLLEKVWLVEVVKKVTASPLFQWSDASLFKCKLELLQWIAEFLRTSPLPHPPLPLCLTVSCRWPQAAAVPQVPL